MAMKKLLWNGPGSNLVTASLEGLVAAVPHLRLLDGLPAIKVVVDDGAVGQRTGPPRVACISGGGSGHEPAHPGLVGHGMLSAAVCGEVFASPSAEAVLAAIHAVAPSPSLLICKNYTGDRINFGLALETATAAGLQVDMVVVDDDTAIDAPGLAGCRGIAGTALVHKVAGATAAAGAPLADVAAAARRAVAATRTLGVALDVCSVPGAPPSTRLGPGDIELGLGIHGEEGYSTEPWRPLSELVPAMLTRMLEHRRAGLEPLAPGTPLALLINNLGGSSALETTAVAHEALKWLAAKGHRVARLYAGAVVTSLDMAGFSLSLMGCDDERLAALDAPTNAPGWPACGGPVTPKPLVPLPPAIAEHRKHRAALLTGRPLSSAAPGGRTLEAAVRAAAHALIGVAGRLNELDARAGDGDCGTTVALAAQALLATPEGTFAGPPHDAMAAIAAVLQQSGGSLGGLCNLGFTAAAAALPRSTAAGPSEWAQALHKGVAAMTRYGHARPGSRTMLDALYPAADALSRAAAAGSPAGVAARAAAVAAAEGAALTKGMAASAGRASYTRGAALSDEDPGAVAASVWLDAVATVLEGA